MGVMTLDIDVAKNLFVAHGGSARGKTTAGKRLQRQHVMVSLHQRAAVPDRHEGLLLCSLSGAPAGIAGSHGDAHGSEVQQAIAEVEGQERRSQHPCYLRHLGPHQHVARANQERPAATHPCPVLRPTRLHQAGTAQANQIHGRLPKVGPVVAQGLLQWACPVPEKIEDRTNGPLGMYRWRIQPLRERLRELDRHSGEIEARINALHRTHPLRRKTPAIPGCLLLTASVFGAAAGYARDFPNGQQFAAWPRLIPRQPSTTDTHVLPGTGGCDDASLRTLLTHGARAIPGAFVRTKRAANKWLCRWAESWYPEFKVVAHFNNKVDVAWTCWHMIKSRKLPIHQAGHPGASGK